MAARFSFLLALFILILSCSGCPAALLDDEQIISCDLVLSEPAAGEIVCDIVTSGSIVFINEWEYDCIAAFDLEGGCLLWRKQNVDAIKIDWSKHTSSTDLCPVGDSIWCLANGATGSYAFSLSMYDGSLLKAVKFACPDGWRVISSKCFERNGFIYLGLLALVWS